MRDVIYVVIVIYILCIVYVIRGSLLKVHTRLEQKPETNEPLKILQKTNPQFRGWYWKRLRLLALNSQTKEILWFNPHPEIGLNRAYLLGQESPLIFTNSKDGHYALWDGYAKLVDGNYTHPSYSDEELGRMENEKWKMGIGHPL